MRVQTTIRMPSELKEQLQKGAVEFGKSFNDYMTMILRKWIKAYRSE